MPTFIKTGFWETTKKGYDHWLNLDLLIKKYATGVQEAPINNTQYGRINGTWAPIVPVDISGKLDKGGFNGNAQDLYNLISLNTQDIDDINDNLSNNYYTIPEIDTILSSVYKYKGSVPTFNDLPIVGVSSGDVYNVEDTGMNYAWTGTEWDSLAGIVDISGKLDKNGYTGTAQDLKNDIDSINQPNVLISAIAPTRVGNTFTYAALGVEAMINKVRYKNPISFSTTIPTAATDFKRVDVIYIGSGGVMGVVTGTEVSTTTAPMPNIPTDTVMVGFVNIYGSTIEPITPTVNGLSFRNSQGQEIFNTQNIITIQGATLDPVTDSIIINTIVAYTIFVDTVNGDDFMAIPEDAQSPFKTTQAAYNAIPNDGQLWTLLYVDSNVTRDMSAPFPPSNRRWELKCNNTGVFDFSNKVMGTTYGDANSLWLNANINVPKSTVKFDIKGPNKLFISAGLNGTTDINFVANTLEITATTNPSGAGVRGLMYTLGSCNVTVNYLTTNFLSQNNLSPIVLARNGKFFVNILWYTTISAGLRLFIPANLTVTNDIELYIAKFKRDDNNDNFGFVEGAVKKVTIGDIESPSALYLVRAITATTNPVFVTEVIFNNSKVVGAILTLVGSSRGEFLFTGRVSDGLVRMYHQANNETRITLTNFQAKIQPGEYYNSYTTLINTTLTFDNYLFTDNINVPKVLVDGQLNFKGTNTLTSLNNNIYLLRDDAPNSVLSIEGAVYTNCRAFGLNTKAVYKLNTFKEKQKEIVIRYKTDLVGRTLDSNMTYIIDGTITLLSGEYIEVPVGGLTLVGYGFDVSQISKNVAGQSIFISPVGNSGNFVTKDMQYNSGLGSVFNITDSNGTHAIELNDVNFQNCSSIGTLSGYRQFTGTTCGFYSCSDGITTEGNWSGFKLTNTNVIGFGASGTLFKKGTSTLFSNRFYIELNLQIATGSKICDFSDTNFTNNKSLQVVNCYTKVNGQVLTSSTTPTLSTGMITMFPNITPYSDKAYFLNNQGIANSRYVVPEAVNNDEAINLGQLLSRSTKGVATIILDGTSSVYSTPHGLGQVPSFAFAGRGGGLNYDVYNTTWDDTNIILTYENPPSAGSQMFNWIALK